MTTNPLEDDASDDPVLKTLDKVLGRLEEVDQTNQDTADKVEKASKTTVARLNKERFYRRRTFAVLLAAIIIVAGIFAYYHYHDAKVAKSEQHFITSCLFPTPTSIPGVPTCYQRLQAQSGGSVKIFVKAFDADVRARLQQQLDIERNGNRGTLPLEPPTTNGAAP